MMSLSGQGPTTASSSSASSHTHTVRLHPPLSPYSVQSQDPEDPWLQAEWGEVLSGQGRAAEASMHFIVAGQLFNRQVQAVQPGEQQLQGPPPPVLMSTESGACV